MSIKKRLYFLREVDRELKLKAEDKGEIKIRNHLFFELAQDSYSMLIIDLCSFFAHFAEDGGFIRRLNNYLAAFRPFDPKKIESMTS